MRALAFLALVALAGCDFVPTLSGNRSDVPQAGSANASPTPEPTPDAVAAAPAPPPAVAPSPDQAAESPQDASHTVSTVLPAGADAPAPGTSAFAPSFDCRGAMSQVETLICNDNRLAQLDRRLTRAYADARADASATARAELLRDQRAFLAARDECENGGCIADLYRDRMADIRRTAATADDSCRAEIGEAAAARLVWQCSAVSPATHPPCNAANSCAMIQAEIDRSCAMFGPDDDIPGFCRR